MDTKPRSVDDFHEFFTATYRDVLAAFDDAGMTVNIEAGTNGHYLLVARTAETPQVGVAATVEVTADGKPLPASPLDVQTWVLAAGAQEHVVPNESPEALVEAVARLLGG